MTSIKCLFHILTKYTSCTSKDLSKKRKKRSLPVVESVASPGLLQRTLSRIRRQAVCRRVLDIVFVVDSSGSIRDYNERDNWNLTKNFLEDLVNNLDVGPDMVRGNLQAFLE